MKTTGMFRRIDDAGRVVIPREIRKILGIKGGDSLEIFADRNEIILRKYDVSIGLSELVRRLENEFSDVKDDIERETADKIYKHINALRELVQGIEEGGNE